MDPRQPIYVPSKGRADHPYTVRTLSHYRVPFFIVVEEPEEQAYQETVRRFGGFGTVLVLDPAYQQGYDACMDLRPDQSRGSGPARNFAWDHAVASGASWYWCMDDNINGFWYYNQNRKAHAGDATPLRLMEDFTDRYENVAMAGPTYYMFVPRKDVFPPFVFNTRIYSCNLIRTDLPQRWRGRYNEDTILSLDLLKAGWCTILFYAYLQWKITTMRLPGGNTAAFYAEEGTLAKSQMLVREHPDVARLTYRFGRAHHYVNYRKHFGNRRLIVKPDAEPVPPAALTTQPRVRPLLRPKGT